MLTWPAKDPDEYLDYQIDWTDYLDGDVIATSAWSAVETNSPGLTITAGSPATDGSKTYVWLSGGQDGETYHVLNRVTTTGGRSMDRTVRIRIRTK